MGFTILSNKVKYVYIFLFHDLFKNLDIENPTLCALFSNLSIPPWNFPDDETLNPKYEYEFTLSISIESNKKLECLIFLPLLLKIIEFFF